ncbi:MAG: hypothetical protein AAFR93_06700 [Pseudomonadota bacterium]
MEERSNTAHADPLACARATPPVTAREVSEHLLHRTGEAMLSGDFEAFMACFQLPLEIETFTGRRVVETADDLRQTSLAVHAYYQTKGVTELFRVCIDASFRDPDTVVATHIARPLKGDVPVQEAYPVLSILTRTDHGWKIAQSQYAVEGEPLLAKALMGNSA